MTRDLTLEAQVQQVLNEMLDEKLIPFALNVGEVTKDVDDYTLHFYDCWTRTAKLHLVKGQSLAEGVRSAVTDRMAKMTGPPHRECI